jgi:hypothetical protein
MISPKQLIIGVIMLLEESPIRLVVWITSGE